MPGYRLAVSDPAVAARGRSRRRYLLVVLVLTGAIVGVLVAAATRPTYTATARSFVSTQAPSSVRDLRQGGAFAQQVGRTYAEVATEPFVLRGVIADLHLATTPEALAQRITARLAPDSVVLSIDAADPSAAQAARIANAVQDALGRTAASLAPSAHGSTRITAIERAVPPASPSSPSAPVDGMLGALAGAAAWLLVALIGAVRRRRPRSGGGLAAPAMS